MSSKSLLSKAAALTNRNGAISAVEKLPSEVLAELKKLRKEYWSEGAPCQMSALFKVCKEEFDLTGVNEHSFIRWLKQGKPNE